jgi:effector-binding domain-containing protein
MQVSLVRVEPMTTAVIRTRATLAELPCVIPKLCGETFAFAKQAGLDPDRMLTLYLNDVMDIECGVLVARQFPDGDRVVCSSTPAGMTARVVHVGPYDALPGVHDALIAWCADNGHELAGPCWELYGHEDGTTPHTDVYYLLAE